MDSLDAQCRLMQLAEGEIRPPDLWSHHRSGSLSCAYEGGELAFTWSAEKVEELARSWRNSDTGPVPSDARLFRDAHRHLESLGREAGLGPADVIVHLLGRAEIRGIWEKEKLVLLVEEIGESGLPASGP